MTFFARLVAAALLVTAACGGKLDSGNDAGSDGSPPPPLDAQPPPWDGGPPPLLDGGQCNNVPIVGPTVTLNEVATDAPPFPSGGSPLFQGVYGLVAFTAYSGPGGSSASLGTAQISMQVNPAKDGFDLQMIAVINSEPPQTASSIATIIGPNQLNLSNYCPQASSGGAASYYFDGSTLWLRAADSGSFVVDEQYSLMTN